MLPLAAWRFIGTPSRKRRTKSYVGGGGFRHSRGGDSQKLASTSAVKSDVGVHEILLVDRVFAVVDEHVVHPFADEAAVVWLHAGDKLHIVFPACQRAFVFDQRFRDHDENHRQVREAKPGIARPLPAAQDADQNQRQTDNDNGDEGKMHGNDDFAQLGRAGADIRQALVQGCRLRLAHCFDLGLDLIHQLLTLVGGE